MSANFRSLAQDSVSLSPIMAGKTKIETEELVGKKLNIIEFGFAPKFDRSGAMIVDTTTGEADVFAVVVFKEYPANYYCCGKILTKICKVWSGEYEGDTELASDELFQNGGVDIKLTKTTTKAGNNLVAVEVL